MSSRFNCVPLDISATTNAIVGRVNASDATLQSVAFELVLPSGPHAFVDVGPFESGQMVTHRLKPTPPIGPDEFRSAFAHCIVTKIEFADGGSWTAASN